MKKISVLAVTLGLLTSTVSADDDRIAERLHLCEAESRTAATIMRQRQRGVPMETMMRTVEDVGKGRSAGHEDDAHNHVLAVIMMAYSRPGYHTEEMQQRAITEFSNTAYLICLKK